MTKHPTGSRPRKLVVAGLVVSDGRILLTQRPADASHPLEWELPGGKIELGESPEEALKRELREELDFDVEVHQIWEVVYHQYPDFELLMLVYTATPVAGSRPQKVWASGIEWLTPDALPSHPILEADQKLVDRLVAEGVPTYHFDRGR